MMVLYDLSKTDQCLNNLSRVDESHRQGEGFSYYYYYEDQFHDQKILLG